MNNRQIIARFLRAYGAVGVGNTPAQPPIPVLTEEQERNRAEKMDLEIEAPLAKWNARIVAETPAKTGEHPVRFIDGSFVAMPVLYLRPPQGWPIPVLVSEFGAVAVRLNMRTIVRDMALLGRVVSFVADPFPWAEVEEFARAVVRDPALQARFVPANRPHEEHNPFDYEVMRTQAYHRCEQEMLTAERLALASDVTVPTLVDGKLASAIGSAAAAERPLLVGVIKKIAADLPPEGWKTLLNLRPGQRTPAFKLTGMVNGKEADMPTASWFLKLAGGPRLAPNWGFVRVDVPWVQFEHHFASDFGFVGRLSRWLIDARCRQQSYARMPVSLEPIVRAEDSLKSLFSPFGLLCHRFLRQAGMAGGSYS